MNNYSDSSLGLNSLWVSRVNQIYMDSNLYMYVVSAYTEYVESGWLLQLSGLLWPKGHYRKSLGARASMDTLYALSAWFYSPRFSFKEIS